MAAGPRSASAGGSGRSPVHSSFRSPSAGRGSRSLRKSSSGPHASLPLTALPSSQDTSTTWLRRITRPRTRYPSPGATRPAIWWIAARPRRSSKARRSRPWPGRLRPRSASRWSTKRASASSPASRRTPAIPFSRRWSSLPGQRASCSRPTDAGGSSSAGQAKRKPPPSSNSARTSLKARASFPCATASRASPSSARRRRRRRGTARAPHSRKPW